MINTDSAFLVVYCAEVVATASFYQKLGFIAKEHTEDKFVVNVGGVELHYILETTEPFAEYRFATNREMRGQGVLIYFGVDDLEQFYRKAKESTLTEIKSNHWGGKEFMFKDPDGYLFVVYEVE